MADKEEVLPQGMVMDGDAVRPITREEAEHGLLAPKPAVVPTPPRAVATAPLKPAEKPEDRTGHAGPPARPQ